MVREGKGLWVVGGDRTEKGKVTGVLNSLMLDLIRDSVTSLTVSLHSTIEHLLPLFLAQLKDEVRLILQGVELVCVCDLTHLLPLFSSVLKCGSTSYLAWNQLIKVP